MLWYFFRFNDHAYIKLTSLKYRTASKLHVNTSPKYNWQQRGAVPSRHRLERELPRLQVDSAEHPLRRDRTRVVVGSRLSTGEAGLVDGDDVPRTTELDGDC